MAINIRRVKRVTDPLDERVRARLFCSQPTSAYSSSGSEHEAAVADEDISLFSGLVRNYLNGTSWIAAESIDRHEVADHKNENNGSDDDDDDDKKKERRTSPSTEEIVREILQESANSENIFGAKLVADVAEATSGITNSELDRFGYLRAVMIRLRELNYNAAVCKSKWDSSGNLTAGSYEYIDVLSPDKKSKRYIVDLGFSGEFEIARATEKYKRCVEALPGAVMVETEDVVKRVVRVMAREGQRSLKHSGMHVPPWRKTRYMLAKWFGPYRRTVNPVPRPGRNSGEEIKLRAVGFCAVGEHLVSNTSASAAAAAGQSFMVEELLTQSMVGELLK